MRVVVAVGGNALLRRGDVPDAATMRRRAAEVAADVAAVAAGNDVVLVHGDGPQVGYLSLEAGPPPRPLDMVAAEAQGLVGYLVAQALGNALPGREVAAILTQVLVDPGDTAFKDPDKPIGPWYPTEAEALAAAGPVAVVHHENGWRRVVASPRPISVVEIGAIRGLVEAGGITICGGGGGIPVVDGPGGLRGVDAAVDKDHTAALLARELGADVVLFLTDVDGVHLGWGTPQQRLIRRAGPAQLGAHEFEAGSMGPKVEAACEFVAAGGARACIGRVGDAAAVLSGASGTFVSTVAAGIECAD